MAKTSKGVILSQASQIKSDYSFALIKATADNKSLVQDASSAELKVNALVEYSKDSQWDPKKLTSLGFPAGCFLIVDLRGQDIHATDLITNLALVRQYGYQAGVIDDLSTLDDIKVLKANQIYLINSGKANDYQDASLNGDEITDGSGKLAVGMSVKWQRDYTNIDVSGDHAGFVGMGQDTLLKGGNAFGYSTNGRDFNAVITPKGLIFRRPDAERMWRLLKPNEIADINSTVGDKVKQEVDSATAEIPAAVSAANSAVSAAESAVAASKVNSDAIVAQSEAISEAKSAMDSATAEIQQTAANAASDAAKIRADVAQVQSEVDTAKAANSASVEALKSDVSAAKQDLADVHDSLTKAQAAAEQNQKAINESIAQINADITQDRKDITSAQQANADTAKQLDTYSKQAVEQGKTIKSIQDKQDGFTATLADVQGSVTQVSDKVDGLSANLKDAQDNVASVKAQADQLSATLTDHAKSIATLTASAKELSSSLEDAGSRLSKVEQTAQTNSSTLSDVQGDLSQVKQDATTLTATLKDAQGNISTLQQKADSVSAQLASAQGDIASLQTDVTGIKATLTSHEGDIHTLQADSKTLKDDMQDAQGDISTLKKTSTDVTSELKDHAGRISKVEQTATTLSSDVSDQQGRISKVEQKATGTEQTVANQQGQINNIKTDAASIHETLTGQGNQIANINVTLNGLDTKYEGVSGNLNNLKSQTQWVIVTSPVDLNNVITPCHEFLKGAVTNAPNESAWWYLTVEGSEGDRVTQTVIADQSNNRYTRRLADSWSAWVRDATQTDVTALSNRITTNSTQITQNKNAITLKADQSTVDNLSGEVSQNKAQLKVQAGQISSKVSSEDFKTLDNKVGGAIAQIDKNTTAIDQTNKEISLKADQTEVDQVKDTASQNSSRLDVMNNEINSKVSSTDVNNILDSKGYATTSTVQSLITQKAGTINESITSLDSKYNTTVTQVQSLTASIDGLQSTVANKADKSQITQLSNMIQSKVSSSDFNALKDETTWKSTDSIDLNTAVSQQKIFVKGGSNLPPGLYWWYVQVEPGYDSRIVQYAVSDRDNLHYSRQYDGSKWSAWSQGATESEITQLRDDINLRVKSGDLLSQINLTAHNTLIQSNKIYLDSSSTVFSGKAFIPSAAITSLDADKITSGYIKVPMSDGNGNSVQVSNNGVDIVSNNQNTKLFSANRGIASVHIDAAGMNFGATTNGTYELLGGLSPLLDDTDGDFGGMSNHNGIGFVVETQQQYGSPYGGDFFSLARSIKGPPSYYNGFLYEATGSGKHEIGSHFFDPIYVHPWGADNYMHATWVSWTAWDNNEKYPAIVQAGSNMGGICFPKSGEVTLFTASGKSFTPSQWKGTYTGYQHGGAGNAYHDPSQGA